MHEPRPYILSRRWQNLGAIAVSVLFIWLLWILANSLESKATKAKATATESAIHGTNQFHTQHTKEVTKK